MPRRKPDPKGPLLRYTFAPGTYKGLVAAIALHGTYVHIMFSGGVDLLSQDTTELLTGTGKRARHIKVTEPALLNDPQVKTLLQAAAALTRP